MRIEIQEGDKSTPERPVWVWRVYDGNDREVGFGVCPSEHEARERAHRSVLTRRFGRPSATLREQLRKEGVNL